MIDMNEVQGATESLARAFEEYKSINDTRLEEIEKRGTADVLLDEHLKRMDDNFNNMQNQITGVKTAMSRSGKGAPGQGAFEECDSAYKRAFTAYLRKGDEVELKAAMNGRKDMDVISDPQGGYSVPPEWSPRIVKRQFDSTPMRQIATVMTISSEAVEMLRDTNEPDAQWISELGTRNDTDQGQIGRIRIPVHEIYAQPKATQKLLDDSSLNIDEWMMARVSDKFSRRENAAFVTGDGIGQPRGFLSYSTAATGDATRSWGVLEHVVTGADGAFASGVGADILIDMMYKLKAGYLPRATWLMPRAVADTIRKFKENTTNAYIWQPGLQSGTPANLLGYPIVLAEDMPSMASGSLSVAFGDFTEGYTIVDRMGLRVLRDPYTSAPFVKFRCNKRVGGDVVNFEAIKLLKFSAS